jgi:sugar phosphate isomerase/epimerase
VRLGVSSYTFVWAVGVPGYPPPPCPLTVHGLLRKAVDLGVRVVQIADNLPLDRMAADELDAVAADARRSGLDLEVGTCGIDPAHLRAYLRVAVRLQSPLVRVVPDTDTARPSAADLTAVLREVQPEYERAGVCLAIENHDRFPAETLAGVMAQFDGRGVGVCLDTANSIGCGEGLETLLRALGRWVVNLHVKDFRATRLPHKKGFVVEGCPAGRGLVDAPRVLAELRRLRRDPNAILELWPPPGPTPAESIAREDAWAVESIGHLRQFIPD